MNLKKLQEEVNRRWELQINNPCHRSADANHALVHMTKALGKIASALNDAEHENRAPTASEVETYLADLVICAARFSHGIVDLNAACVTRLAEKFSEQKHCPSCKAPWQPQNETTCGPCGAYVP